MKIYLSTTSLLDEEKIPSKFIKNINRRFPLYLSTDDLFFFKHNQDRVLFFYFTNPYYSSIGMASIVDRSIHPNINHLIQNYKLISISDSVLIKLSNQKYIFTILFNSYHYDINNLDAVTDLLKAIVPYFHHFDQLNIDSIIILLPPELKCHHLYIRQAISEFEKLNPVNTIFNKKEPMHNLEINKNKLQMVSQYSNKKLIQCVNKVINSQLTCYSL